MNFRAKLSNILNARQSRSIVLTGNVHDLFFDGESYVPLIDYLSKSYHLPATQKQNGRTQLIYQVNSPVEIKGDIEELRMIWDRFRGREDKKYSLDDLCEKTHGNPVLAFEFFRQLTMCSRRAFEQNASHNDLLILIEAADLMIPQESVARMSILDRRAVAVLHDWFSDPDFLRGPDAVIMLSESLSNLNSWIVELPQMLSVEIPSPTLLERQEFVDRFKKPDTKIPDKLAENTAGLSLHALRQLLCKEEVSNEDVINKVEEHIVVQLGDSVEFKKPTHTLDDVVGFSRLKSFLRESLTPRVKAGGAGTISGAAVGGPIGGGKTFICEAWAAELGMPVLVLKNLRSMWYGQTDVIFERLKRVLTALDRAIIFVDEADTQFGGVGEGTHETERRLTGKIQAMMSDSALRGKIVWLLMTARINLLSPDIRRPGRVGDLIIPVLDPEEEDREEFLKWTFGDLLDDENDLQFDELTKDYSAAAFAALRSEIKASANLTKDGALAIITDLIPPDIGETREYQTLQAKLNCTRQSLLFPEPLPKGELEKRRVGWRRRIAELEANGIR